MRTYSFRASLFGTIYKRFDRSFLEDEECEEPAAPAWQPTADDGGALFSDDGAFEEAARGEDFLATTHGRYSPASRTLKKGPEVRLRARGWFTKSHRIAPEPSHVRKRNGTRVKSKAERALRKSGTRAR